MAGDLQIKAKLSRAGAKAWAELGNIIKSIPDCDKYERDSSCYTLERGECVKDYLENGNGDCRDYIYLESDKKDNTHLT